MKKRLISLLLVFAAVLGMLPTVALAAPSEEEALGEVSIYSGGQELDYLSINGKVQKQLYTYYNYVSPTNGAKEIPAYCVNPNLYGVPQTVEPGQSIKYLANERATDPKVMGIIASGYPSEPLETLKLQSKYEAYYATKMALWCYLISGWNINNLKINPGCADQAAAQRVLAAAKWIYSRGSAWTSVLTAGVTATPDQATAYPVTINGKQYKQQVFTVHSNTWPCGLFVWASFTSPSSVPAGTKLVDMDNQEIDRVTMTGTGDGYDGQFKVLYPLESIEGQTGSVQLSFGVDIYQYAVFYAVCAEKDKYGNLQNYMCDTDPFRTMQVSAYSSYSDEPVGGPPDTGLKIIKLETGTENPLSGARFEVIDPEGATMGVFATNSKGEILIPLTLCGNYTVIERDPPPFHLFAGETVQNVNVEYGKVATVTFYNAPYGSLRIEKYSNTGEKLPGAVVRIKHIESGQVYTQETGVSGVAFFDKLKPGAYEIVETTAPIGWLKDDTVYNTTVLAGETAVFPLVNQELPGLRIIKYDRKTMEVLPGVTFAIYHDNVFLGNFSTDAMGEILLTNVAPGTYRAFEVDTGNEGL